MSDKKIEIPEDLAKAYSRIKNVSLDTARKNLEDNFKKESDNVNLEQQYYALIRAFREMAPKLHGVVLRETDTAHSIKSLTDKTSKLECMIEDLRLRFDVERNIYKGAIQLAIDLNKPFYVKLWNRIKCILKR